MKIIILGPENAGLYRDIRLQALKDHPEAFSSSFEEESAYTLERFSSRLNEDFIFTFGALMEDQLIGTVTLATERRNKLKHRANIAAMYVDPEYRRSGTGKKLMEEAIKKAKELEGIEQIYLSVTSTNEAAKKLYLSLGFTTYGKDIKALKINNRYYDEDLMAIYF
ncbi:GNAT family N-acetyltransferase [Neobacillus terrae]|uniref:GNAT family N-acetyltransferase n=1 Tax=Neobacillus terrae TaxID=3034837 RepID=UPI00140A1BDF|nr:GNAT family N-acetyltransferase [Neobacillus terrae]